MGSAHQPKYKAMQVSAAWMSWNVKFCVILLIYLGIIWIFRLTIPRVECYSDSTILLVFELIFIRSISLWVSEDRVVSSFSTLSQTATNTRRHFTVIITGVWEYRGFVQSDPVLDLIAKCFETEPWISVKLVNDFFTCPAFFWLD